MVKDLIKEIVITDDDKPGKRKALDAGAAQKVDFLSNKTMDDELIYIPKDDYIFVY